MATNDALNNSLQGQTGTGKYVGDTDPIFSNTIDVATAIRRAAQTENSISFGNNVQNFLTNSNSRLDISDSGVRLGGANSRVTTILDEDTLSSDSDTALATQQSIKAYVDSIQNQIKVVQYTLTTSSVNDTTTSTTLSNTSLTGSITPISASNKILVMCTGSLASLNQFSNNVDIRCGMIDIYRSSGTPAAIVGSRIVGRILVSPSTSDSPSIDSFLIAGQESAGDTTSHTYFLRFSAGSPNIVTSLLGLSSEAIMLILELKV